MATKKVKKDDSLAGLFGSHIRPRLLRAFLHGVNEVQDPNVIKKTLGVTMLSLKKELNSLVKAGILRKKEMSVSVDGNKKRKKIMGYALDRRYPHLDIVENLFLNTFPFGGRDISENIQRLGNIKTIILSGVFVSDPSSNADILIVGTEIQEEKLRKLLAELERTIGSEVRYILFEPNDFLHRVSINDRLLRGITDHSYRVLIDKLRIMDKNIKE